MIARILFAATVFSLAGMGGASAYVGPSFLQIPGAEGGWKGEQYKNWFKVDGNYWQRSPTGMLAGMRRGPPRYSGPNGPREGAGKLMIAVEKSNPVLAPLMEKCVKKTPIAEMSYAESSELSRTYSEIGARPEGMPEFFEYKLKDVLFAECVDVPNAPQQSFVVTFNDIARLNYDSKEPALLAKLDPAALAPLPPSGTTRSYVLTWFGMAHDISDDQCPMVNSKPTEDDYYALMTKEAAAKERVALGEKGVSYENNQMAMRGPNKLNVTLMPGIVRDPGHVGPRTTLARGLDLDGNDGTGAAPAGVCKHTNYASADGRKGIDNQLYAAMGCIPSFQGHKGFIMQFANNNMRDGAFAMILQITGLDDARNDNSVELSLFYTVDPMAKSGSGADILPDYTFRVTDKPEFTHYFGRLHGKVVDGVLTTDPAPEFRMNLGQYGNPVSLHLANASVRLELLSNGNIKGLLGGYQDWRPIASKYAGSAAEQVHGFQVPGLYNALKKSADGMKDPITGECNGISSAFDIEGIPAYLIGPGATKRVAQAGTRPAQ